MGFMHTMRSRAIWRHDGAGITRVLWRVRKKGVSLKLEEESESDSPDEDGGRSSFTERLPRFGGITLLLRSIFLVSFLYIGMKTASA